MMQDVCMEESCSLASVMHMFLEIQLADLLMQDHNLCEVEHAQILL